MFTLVLVIAWVLSLVVAFWLGMKVGAFALGQMVLRALEELDK